MPYTPFKVMVVELLEQIVKGLREMADQNETMKTETDRMANDVADMKTVVASAVAMITGLASQIHANADDPTAMHALADQLEASKNDLAAAVAANTPAAPADDGSAAGAGTTDTTSGSGADAGAGAATGTATDSGAGSDAGAQATAAQATTTDSGAGADTSGADTTASTGSTDTGAADAGAGDGSDGSGGDGAAVEPPAAIDPTVDASVGDQVTDNQNGGA